MDKRILILLLVFFVPFVSADTVFVNQSFVDTTFNASNAGDIVFDVQVNCLDATVASSYIYLGTCNMNYSGTFYQWDFINYTSGQSWSASQFPSSPASFANFRFSSNTPSSGDGGSGGDAPVVDEPASDPVSDGGPSGGPSGPIQYQNTGVGGVEVLQPASQGIKQPFCPAGDTISRIPLKLYNPYSTEATYSFELDGVDCELPAPVTLAGKTSSDGLELLNCVCPAEVGAELSGFLTVKDSRDSNAFARIPIYLSGSPLAGAWLAVLIVGLLMVFGAVIGFIVMMRKSN